MQSSKLNDLEFCGDFGITNWIYGKSNELNGLGAIQKFGFNR